MNRKGERDLALIIGMLIVLVVIIGMMIIVLDLSASVTKFIAEASGS